MHEFTSYWTTSDLGSSEIRKFQENLKTSWNYSLAVICENSEKVKESDHSEIFLIQEKTPGK